jgi:membrane protein implicated in regulation of membrane protease activity
MRNVFTYVLATVAIVGAALFAAPGASAASTASKDHPSSDLPWVIGIVVIVAIALGLLLLRLRSGVSKRDVTANGRFRRP